MIMNSTSATHHYHHYEVPIDEPTAIAELAATTDTYDSVGASLFICIVLLWYSMGMVFMLGMQIRARAETVEDCARRRAKLLIEGLRDQTHTKEILEELVDKQNRDKLWDIYLGTTDNIDDKRSRAEILRIRNIEKQLAVINRNRLIMNDITVSPTGESHICRTRLDLRPTPVIPDLSTIPIRPRTRRRSSLDQQIIEKWKLLVDESKAHEQLPWPIRKLMILRHFRRHTKESLRYAKQLNGEKTVSSSFHEHAEDLDDERCYLLSNNDRSRRITELPLETVDNQQQNPYLTYFHLPNNNIQSISTNILDHPLASVVQSKHYHILQINDDESQC